MDNRIDECPGLRKAYHTFRSELTVYLESAHRALAQDRRECVEMFPELGMAFHRVKGGAGFFGLSDIAQCAAVLEELLFRPIEQLQDQIGEVQRVVAQLEQRVKELPADAADSQERKGA